LSSVARAWWRMRRWWRRHRSGQRGPGSGGRGPRSLFPVPVASSSLFLSLSISLFLAHYFFPLFRQWKARHNVSRPSLSPTGPPSHPPPCPGPWPIPPLSEGRLRQWSSLLSGMRKINSNLGSHTSSHSFGDSNPAFVVFGGSGMNMVIMRDNRKTQPRLQLVVPHACNKCLLLFYYKSEPDNWHGSYKRKPITTENSRLTVCLRNTVKALHHTAHEAFVVRITSKHTASGPRLLSSAWQKPLPPLLGGMHMAKNVDKQHDDGDGMVG
jgi:hypothetical protein